MPDADPEVTEPTTDDLAVGIQALAAGEFIADGDDFSFHGHMGLEFLIRIGGMGVELSQIAQVGFGYRLRATPNQKEQSLLGPASHIGAGDETGPFLYSQGCLGGLEDQVIGILAELGRIDSPLAGLGGLVEPAAEGIPAMLKVLCKASEGGPIGRLHENMVDRACG